MRGRQRLAAFILVLATALAVAGTASASYKAKISGGVLTFTGSAASDKLVLRLKPGGETKLQGDVAGHAGVEFEFGRGLFTSIVVNAGGGNDVVLVSEANGVFTTTEATTLRGGNGRDRLTGGTGGEALAGGTGSDKVFGKGGPDSIFWKAGDGNDTIDGQGGPDTLGVTGTGVNDGIVLRASSGALRAQTGAEVVVAKNVEGANVAPLAGIDGVDIGDLTGTGVSAVNIDLAVAGVADAFADTVSVDCTGGADVASITASSNQVLVNGLSANLAISGSSPSDRVTVNGLGGGDTLTGGTGLAALTQLTLDGGDGNDTLNGGNGADFLLGGNQNDVVDGNGGNDTVFLGDGNDTAVWDPGDASDIVEGQTGNDVLDFNGAPGAEIFAASSNGGRLLFTRNVGNIVMDVDDVETLDADVLGGIDTFTVNDLGPTDVTSVFVDLGVGGLGDGAADAVTVNGTTAVDLLNVSGSAGSVLVQGVAFGVQLLSSESANDTLTVNLSSGDDIFSAASLASTYMDLLTV
jgi:Ca2+-binding RTX toxin-like protein